MKGIKTVQFAVLLCILLLSTSSLFAGEGADLKVQKFNSLAGNIEGNGGDIPATKKKIQSYILLNLQDDLKTYLKIFKIDSITDLKVQNLFRTMINTGLYNDVEKSPYVPREHCTDHANIEHDAVAIGDKGSEICFNLTTLSQKNPTAEDLIGLAIHEHSRHFGNNEDGEDAYIGSYFTPGLRVVQNINQEITNSTPNSSGLEFYYRKAALDFNIIGPRVATTDWILVEEQNKEPVFDPALIQLMTDTIKRENRASNPNFEIRVNSVYSEEASVVTESLTGSTTICSYYPIWYDNSHYCVPYILYWDYNTHRYGHLLHERFMTDYFHSEKRQTLVRFVVEWEQTLSSINDDQLLNAKMKIVDEYKERFNEISDTLNGCLKTASNIVETPFRWFGDKREAAIYKRDDLLGGALSYYSKGSERYGRQIGATPNAYILSPCIGYVYEYNKPSYDYYNGQGYRHYGVTSDNVFYLNLLRENETDESRWEKHTSLITSGTDQLVKQYTQKVKGFISNYYSLASEAYNTAISKGLTPEIAKDIVRDFRDIIFRIHNDKLGLTHRVYTDKNGKYTDTQLPIIDDSWYREMLNKLGGE